MQYQFLTSLSNRTNLQPHTRKEVMNLAMEAHRRWCAAMQPWAADALAANTVSSQEEIQKQFRNVFGEPGSPEYIQHMKALHAELSKGPLSQTEKLLARERRLARMRAAKAAQAARQSQQANR